MSSKYLTALIKNTHRRALKRLALVLRAAVAEYTGSSSKNAPRIRWTALGRFGANAITQAILIWLILELGAAAKGDGPVLLLGSLLLFVALAQILGAAVYAIRGVHVHHFFGHSNPTNETGARKLVLQACLTAVTMIWLLPPPWLYALIHGKHHSWLATKPDPDLAALRRRGLRPGMSPGWYRAWFRRQRWNLATFLHEISMDARDHVDQRAGRWHIICFALIWSGALVAAISSGHLVFLSAAWLLVRCAAAQANFTQMVSEHTWARSSFASPRKVAGELLTFHRRVGYPLPQRTGRLGRDLLAKGIWALRTLATLPVRMGVAAADLKDHHTHHAHPRADWPNSACAPSTAREVWGNFDDWNEIGFAQLAALPPNHWR